MLEELIRKQIPKLKKMKVISRDNNRYKLLNNGKEIILYINFYNVDENNIKYIYANDVLINKNDNIYNFGPINSKFGKNLNMYTIDDLLLVETDKDIIYLQRYYG